MTTRARNQPVGAANERHDLYRWVQGGQEWACCAYDHGPMCRRCQPVDGVMSALLDNVQEGLMHVWDTDREGWKFQVTESGEEKVKDLIRSMGA